MGAGHAHGAPANGHAGGRHRWRLAVAFGLVAALLVVELVVGLLAGSLALVSDAGHMAGDVVALGAALVATRIATRPDTTGRRTYGSYRAEVFASGLTVLVMLAVAAYVVLEAIGRLRSAGAGPEVPSGAMLAVGVVGLVVNVVSMLLLHEGAAESLNVRGAYNEVVADAAGSVGVIVAGVLVAVTDEPVWDTVVAIVIGAYVAVRAVVLGRQVLAVLGQHVPEGLVLDDVVADLEAVPGVSGVHDLHVWTLTSGMNVATAHLVVAPGSAAHDVLLGAQTVLATQHRVDHATLQTESAPTRQCHEVNW